MNREEKSMKIAEACGWKFVEDWHGPTGSFNGSTGWGGAWMKPSGSISFNYYPPEYFSDLNACYEMEKALVSDHMRDRMSHMLLLVGNDEFPMWHTTASERA